MSKKVKNRLILIGLILTVLIIALVDALDLTVKKTYLTIPHGSHSHYLPLDKDPNASLHDFPMEPPKADERIMPDGKVVKIK